MRVLDPAEPAWAVVLRSSMCRWQKSGIRPVKIMQKEIRDMKLQLHSPGNQKKVSRFRRREPETNWHDA